MSNVTPPDARFKENMGAFFHDLLRAAGITMTPGNAHERIREVGERMAAAIEHASERKSIQVIRKLQTAVSEAFDKMEKELASVQELVLAQQKVMEDLKARLDAEKEK
jgi:hypothetical protein